MQSIVYWDAHCVVKELQMKVCKGWTSTDSGQPKPLVLKLTSDIIVYLNDVMALNLILTIVFWIKLHSKRLNLRLYLWIASIKNKNFHNFHLQELADFEKMPEGPKLKLEGKSDSLKSYYQVTKTFSIFRLDAWRWIWFNKLKHSSVFLLYCRRNFEWISRRY